MYEKFTDRARKVMQLACQEAQRFNHEYIDGPHVLIGLVKEGSGVAANVLKSLNVDLRKIRLEVERTIQAGPYRDEIVLGKLPHTDETKRLVACSVEEAHGLNHGYVGTEHLLLGLLRAGGKGAESLAACGVTADVVRREVLALLDGDRMPSARSLAELISDKESRLLAMADNLAAYLRVRFNPPATPPSRQADPERALQCLYVDWAEAIVQEIKGAFAMIRAAAGASPPTADPPAIVTDAK